MQKPIVKAVFSSLIMKAGTSTPKGVADGSLMVVFAGQPEEQRRCRHAAFDAT